MVLPNYPFIFAFAFIYFGQCMETDVSNWPSLVFDEGKTASLPCLPKGDANAYFWRKGRWFNASENVASIVHGISDKHDKYEVLSDGTLKIAKFSKEDEGRYFCRIASEVNECHGSLNVYLKVKTEALDISIKGCDTTSSCLKNFESPTEIELSCSANVVSEVMTLKWYNGTKELKGDVTTITGSNAPMLLKMINVIDVFVEDSSQLTCEADGFNIPRTMAIVKLNIIKGIISEETGDSTMASSAAVIALGVLCAILAIVVVSLIVFMWKKTTGKPTTQNLQNIKNNGDEVNASKTLPGTKELSNATEVDETASPETEKMLTATGVDETTSPDTEKKPNATGVDETPSPETEKTLNSTGVGDTTSPDTEKMLNATGVDETKKENPLEPALETGKGDQQQKGNESIQEKERQLKVVEALLKEKDGVITNLRSKLNDKEKKLEGKDMEIRKKDTKLTQEQRQRHELQKQVENLPQMKQTIQELEQQKKDMQIETGKKNKQLQGLCMEITELKERALQDLTNESIKVAIVVKPEKYRWEESKFHVLSSKYTMVRAITSNTPNKDLNAMTKNIVESTFHGGNSCIVIFGDPGSGVVSTLHGTTNVKGLIEDISNQMFCLLEKLNGREFQVVLSINMCNTEGAGQSLTLHYPEGQDVFIKTDRWEHLKKNFIKVADKLTGLTSKMAPNASHMNRQGFIRYMVEITIPQGKPISGNLTIVSVIDVKQIHRLWTAEKAENPFEKLLFPVLRDRDSVRFLISHCHPEQVDGVEKTCKATEAALDKITLPAGVNVPQNET